MSRGRKRTLWKRLALIPLTATLLLDDDGVVHMTDEKEEAPIWPDEGLGEHDQQFLYQGLLLLPWLAGGVRYAVMRHLGRSVQQEKSDAEQIRMNALRELIACEEMAMKERARRNGKRPKDPHNAAVAKVAKAVRMTPEALQRQLTRYKRTQLRSRSVTQKELLDRLYADRTDIEVDTADC